MGYFGKVKIQKLQVTSDEVMKCIKLVMINQFLVMLPILLFTSLFMGDVYSKDRLSIETFPNIITLLMHLFICVIVEEILFYYSHRLLHYGPFYTHIHKVHHQFKAPIGIASEYSHPIEFIVSNLIPITIGPIVAKSHFLVAILWYSIAVIGTISHHSGYNLPWMIGGLEPFFHDYHHYSFKYNFGLIGLLDWLHSTNKGYNEYKRK